MAKTETQPYQVLKKEKDLELRKYPPATMATISMEAKSYKDLSSTGFRTLVSFIFGGNEDQKNIAMTSPVHMNINDSQSSMSFLMPAEFSIDNLPQPDNAAIKIETSAEEYVTAIQFGGFADDEKIKKYAAQLESALKENQIEYIGNFRFLGYSSPYELVNRSNEIIVKVLLK